MLSTYDIIDLIRFYVYVKIYVITFKRHNMSEGQTEVINGRHKSIADYWLKPEAAEQYGKFAEQVIPANFTAIKPAHAALAHHIVSNNLPLRAVDMGSHQGHSTWRLLQDLTEYSRLMSESSIDMDEVCVTGIDCVPAFVESAKKQFSLYEGIMNFIEVPEESWIPNQLEDCYSVATAFWLDQVIPKNSVLYQNLGKTFDMLSPGGALAIVRMAQESFSYNHRFAFYGHNKAMNRNLTLSDFRIPEPFINILRLPQLDSDQNPIFEENSTTTEKDEIKFIDYFRTREAMQSFLSGVGFRDIQVFPLHHGLTTNRTGQLGQIISNEYRGAFKAMSDKYPEMASRSTSDGEIPLHEIIIAVKPK